MFLIDDNGITAFVQVRQCVNPDNFALAPIKFSDLALSRVADLSPQVLTGNIE